MQRVARPANRAAWLKADLAAVVTDRDRLADTALALGLVVVFLAAFAQAKGLITAIQPFAWDPALAAADRALHFGLAPGAALQAVLGHPLVLTLVTGAYNFWLSLTMFVLFFACFARTDRLARMQFLLAFVLAWMLGGNVLATLFSSAGPVYVERLGLGTEFAPLMAALADHAAVAPVSVLHGDRAGVGAAGPVGANAGDAGVTPGAEHQMKALGGDLFRRQIGAGVVLVVGVPHRDGDHHGGRFGEGLA
jgi:hypothetical protein